MNKKIIIMAAVSFILGGGIAKAEVPYIGKADAKIEVAEYALLNCAPCKETHKALMPKLQKFIDEGKVKYQFKTLGLSPESTQPAQILSCAKPGDYYKVFDAMYLSQEKWFDKNKLKLPELKTGVAKYVSAKDADKCVADKKLEAQIQKDSKDAVNKYRINSAPSFIINGEKLLVAKDENSVIDAVKLALEGKSINKVVQEKAKKVLVINANDRVLGDAKAPVTIFEYASLSCPHCAKFHSDVLPTIKKDYISKGKVKLVYRDFPLNAPALQAAILTRCVDSSKYYELIANLFALQKEWVSGKDDMLPKLKAVASANGISSQQVDTCLANKKIEEQVLTSYKDASEIAVSSTPSFFINGMPAAGMHDPKSASKTIDEALKQAASPAK